MFDTKGVVFMGAVMPTGLTEFICTQILQAKDGDCLMSVNNTSPNSYIFHAEKDEEKFVTSWQF